MKVWKKLSAVALSLIMVMALSVMASAAATETKSDNEANASGGINAVANAENTIKIAKEIIFVNGENTNVREPNITYTYTISAVETDSLSTTVEGTTTPATVTGPLVSNANVNMTTTVKPGVLNAVTGSVENTKTSTVVFADTNTKIAATSAGTSDRKYASFTFTPSEFSEAGIYRYKITESTNNTKASVGIVENATYAADRYLDVYVKWNDEHTAREIYGYVLFEGNTYDIITTDTTKSAGYVNTATTDGQQADVDVYTTQNLLITGKTTGALADANHNFPVIITFTKASGLMDGIKLDFSVTNNGALTKAEVATDTDPYVVLNTPANGTVRNGSTIFITGIPAASTVVMSERNDTPDSYKVKVGTSDGGVDALDEATVNAGATSGNTTSKTLSTAKISLFITNTLDAISPTGVTLRYAPYLAMMGAGIVALPLSLRKKEEEF